MRTSISKSFVLTPTTKSKLLSWASQFSEIVWLDSNNYAHDTYSSYKAILAVDALTSIKVEAQGAFNALEKYQKNVNDWTFGYLTYDLKNELEDLHSSNHDGVEFPDIFFVQILVKKNMAGCQNTSDHLDGGC